MKREGVTAEYIQTLKGDSTSGECKGLKEGYMITFNFNRHKEMLTSCVIWYF